jgi:hypothetical protein
MTLYKEVIHNIQTNEITEREYSKAEIAEMETAIAKIELETTQIAAKEAARAAAMQKLGLTANELAAIFS